MMPLLAHIYASHRVTYPCWVQPKLNGIRALYQNGHFQSRDLQPFPPGLLDHLAKPLLKLFGPQVVLDGELYKHGWPLQRINGAVTPIRGKPNEDTEQIEYHVFDVVDYTKSFEERFALIQEANTNIVETLEVANQTNADVIYNSFIKSGYEGMMYRLGACPYTTPHQTQSNWLLHNALYCNQHRSKYLSNKDNRVWHLLKRKNWLDDEFEFLSLNETIGELGESGFQMWCATKSGRRFKLGSGLTQAQVQHYMTTDVRIEKVKVKYLVLSEDGIPLNATILAIL